MSHRIQSMGCALAIAACAAVSTPTQGASVSPTGVLPSGTFVSDTRADVNELGLVQLEILWDNIQPITLTIRLVDDDGDKIRLRLNNVNDSSQVWLDFHIHLDDTVIGSADNNPGDDPVWDTLNPVEVIPSATTSSYLLNPTLDTLNNDVDLFFNPVIQAANQSNPNGQLLIGAYPGSNLSDWIIDVSSMTSNEFTLTLNPTVIPVPSAAWIGALGFGLIVSVSRRRDRYRYPICSTD